eukprot:2194135-Pyramimonas_sp.AAC.2
MGAGGGGARAGPGGARGGTDDGEVVPRGAWTKLEDRRHAEAPQGDLRPVLRGQGSVLGTARRVRGQTQGESGDG